MHTQRSFLISCTVLVFFVSQFLCKEIVQQHVVYNPSHLLALKGGGVLPEFDVEQHEELTIHDNTTLRNIFSRGGNHHVLISGGTYAWDWRMISPWFKRLSDEHAEFPLQPLPGSVLHVRGEPSRLDGQWDFHAECQGSFVNLQFCHSTKALDAREMMLINGGPWSFQRCQLRSAACQTLRCEMQAEVAVEESFLGGYGMQSAMELVGDDDLRASNGAVVSEGAVLRLRGSRVELTGYLDGSALKFRDAARGELQGCTLRRNVVGVSLDGSAGVRVEESRLLQHNLSHFMLHPGNNVSLALRANAGVGQVWAWGERPRRLTEEENALAPSPPRTAQELFEDECDIPVYEKLRPGEPSRYWFFRNAGLQPKRGPSIVYCLFCGATNDLDDSSTCGECFGRDFQPKFGLGVHEVDLRAAFSKAPIPGPSDPPQPSLVPQPLRDSSEAPEGSAEEEADSTALDHSDGDDGEERVDGEEDGENAWSRPGGAGTEHPWFRPEEEEEAESEGLAGDVVAPPTAAEVEAGGWGEREEDGIGLGVLRRQVGMLMERKERLKAQYRAGRDPSVRAQLVEAQLAFARAKDRLRDAQP